MLPFSMDFQGKWCKLSPHSARFWQTPSALEQGPEDSLPQVSPPVAPRTGSQGRQGRLAMGDVDLPQKRWFLKEGFMMFFHIFPRWSIAFFWAPAISILYNFQAICIYIYINMSWVLLANPMLTRPKSEPKMNRATTKLRFLGVFIVRGTPD